MTTPPATIFWPSMKALHVLLLVSLLSLTTVACSWKPTQASSPSTQPGTCEPSHLAFSLHDGDGRFNGMSHSGTTLVLRNTGTKTCRVPSMPQPGFTNADGQPLEITAQPPADLNAGSTPPLVLAYGTSVNSDLRWVSSNVYDNGYCQSPAFIMLALGEQTVTSPFMGHLCGPGGRPITYTLTPFRPIAATTTATTAKTVSYTCADGRVLLAVYPDSDTAVLTLDGRTQRLHTAVAADGARYVGKHWQWWAKGMHEARLTPLKPGEMIASSSGVSCTVR
ncbi:MAG: DUF4232 domain-containing protein [Rhodanobacter sp.]